MSTTNNVDHSKIDKKDLINKIPPKDKKWQGRSICSISNLTCLFGASLIITGIVLLALQAYNGDFLISGISSTSIGGCIFLLGLITHCCRNCSPKSLNKKDIEKANKKNTDPQQTRSVTAPPQPLSKDINTREFFESEGVFGLPQELIDELSIWRLYRNFTPGNENEKWNVDMDAGFILYGPPGTGKTTIAKQIAKLLGGTYYEQKSSDLTSEHLGGTEANVSRLFRVEGKDEFRVITIDEIDGFLSKRTGINKWTDRFTSHFLAELGGTAERQPKFILVGTTNEFDMLDPALIRDGRLGKCFEIKPPDLETRKKIFNYHLGKIKLDKSDWSGFATILAERTVGFSCAKITIGLLSAVKKKALLDNDRAITKDDFLSALENNKSPSKKSRADN